MPFIIAVLIIVLASVGFTLFQTKNKSTVTEAPESATTSLSLTDVKTTDVVDASSSTPDESPSSDAIAAVNPPPATSPSSATTVPPLSKTPQPNPRPVPLPASNYTNGTYSSQVSYRTPGGRYGFTLSLTIMNDTVTASSIYFDAGSNDSYSKNFSRAYQSQIIGKDLGTIRPSRIGGASLTTQAFNDALASVRSQAS